MKRLFVPVLFCAAALPAQAQHASQPVERGMFTITTRPGVSQSFFVAGMGGVKPQAVAIVYTGGYGTLNLRMEGGQAKFGQGNFLVRARTDFIRNGVLPVLVDVPSDERQGVSDQYRFSDKQVADARAILAEVRKRAPGLPIFIVTTSRSTLSGAHLARSLSPEEAAGVMLSSSISVSVGPSSTYTLSGFNWKSVKLPLLIVHHRGDTCRATPYGPMARAAEGFALISVKGGKPPESEPCEPFAAHGFYGKEAETVDAIAGWMLKKPFAKEIE
jgi:hypothetical protein